MELVETLEINGEEREIADAYAREQIATNAQNIATNVDGITELNNNLNRLAYDDVAGGKNIFDGEIELGSISVSDGQDTNDLTRTRSKNFIKVKPNTTYAFTREEGIIRWVIGYKSDKTVITDATGTQFTSALLTIPESDKIRTFTTSATTEYVRWYDTRCTNVYEKVQIEEGTATEYKPYIPSVVMLANENSQQSTEMLDNNMLGWVVPEECPVKNYVDADGVFHQRVGRVDLGSIGWEQGGDNNKTSWVPISWKGDYKIPTAQSLKAKIYCSKYTIDSAANVEKQANDKTIAINVSGWVYIYDSAFASATASEFKASLKGVYLYYELATEKTISVDGNEAVTKLNDDVSEIKKELSDSLPIGTILTVVDSATMSSDMWKLLKTGTLSYQDGGALVEISTITYQKIK